MGSVSGTVLALAPPAATAADAVIDSLNFNVPGTQASPWVIGGNLIIGQAANGQLIVNFNGSVEADTVTLGAGAGRTGTLTLNGVGAARGVLTADQVVQGAGAGFLGFSGGTLRAGADQSAFLSGFASGGVSFGANGGAIDTQAFDVGIPVVLSGIGGLTKLGSGTLTLSGTNTYVGETNIADGTVAVSSDANLGAAGGALRLNGGTLRNTAAIVSNRPVFVDDSGATLRTDADLTLTGTVADGATSGLFTKAGTGTLTLSGTNSYTGTTRILDGTLVASGGNAIGDTSSIILVAGQLRITANETASTLSSSLPSTATVDLDGGSLTMTHNSLITRAYYYGSITGSGGLIKDGTYFQGIGGDSSYTGTTQVLGGTLAAVGSGRDSIPDTSAVTVAAGATFSLVPHASIAGREADDETIGSLAGAGSVTLGGQTLTAGDGSNTAFSGVVSGTGGLTKAGTGTLTLSGANTYTGTTRVTAGTLELSGGSALADSTAVELAGGTLDLVDSETVGSLAGTGTADLGVQTLTAGGNGASTTFSGTVTGSGGLVKDGSGTLTLAGNSAGFAGTTQVQNGSLAITGTIGGDVSASTGGRVGGTGTVGNGLALVGSGTLVGIQGQTLRVNGDLTMAAGSTFDATLGGPSGTALVDVGGNLTLDGTLNVSDAGGFGAGVYRLISYAGTLTDNGLAVGTLPSGTSSTVQTAAAGQVNLVVAAVSPPPTGGGGSPDPGPTTPGVRFWDGSGTTANGAVDGGSGVWSLDRTNWTGADGAVNGAWTPAFAVFQGGAATVTVSDDAGAVAVTGLQFATDGVRIAGDPLTLAGDGGAATVRIGDGTTAGAGMTATIAAPLTGDSGLVKTDLGTLVLGGVNSYRGGTTIAAGTLSVAADANLGAAAGGLTVTGGTLRTTGSFDSARSVTLTGGGTVDVADATTLQLSGTVSGDGALVKRGAGALVLTGANAYGGTVVEAGTLVGDAGSIAGDAAVAGALVFRQAGDGTYAGAISGQGGASVVKEGAGRLSLSGDSAAFAGTTTVAAGTLAVDGTLGGVVEVATGGRLGGSGTVGTARVAGTVAPGNSIGTLSVAGDLTQQPGSTYEVELDADGRADRIAVAGSATVDGATVTALPAEGRYTLGTRYTILTAAGGVTGSYAALVEDAPFVTLALAYDPGAVYLDVVRDGTAFCDVSATANQCAAGTAVEGLGAGHTLYRAITGLPDDASARAAFDSLSGEVHASVHTALLEDSRLVRDAATDRLRAAGGGVAADDAPVTAYGAGGPAAAPAADGRFAAWGRVFGAWGENDGDGNAATLDRSTGGFVMGADGLVAETWRVGVMAGYSHSRFDVDGRSSSGSSDNVHVGLYAGAQWGGLGLRGGAAYTWHDIATDRTVAFAGYADALDAGYHGGTGQLFGEVGYRLDTPAAALEPFAALAHVVLRTDGFTERGGEAALAGDDGRSAATVGTLGLRAARAVSAGDATVRLHGMAGWRHAAGDVTPSAELAFAGGAPFAVDGVPLARDAAVVEAGLAVRLGGAVDLALSYGGQFAEAAREHGARLGLTVRF
ncbi:autotransporter outer membrane beta-barrel domain-containing protein [Azospirillum sp. A39]|uniref:autotransporter outer membrane beta-barrel domain-containing protein n=1 Tax=Azospirillum sp. A39 TaxID=3462279 RepID=UPI0040466640